MPGKKRIITIYGLRRPGTSEIRYVGQTRRSIAERMSRHINKPHQQSLAKWFSRLNRDGLKPEVIVLATLTRESWRSGHQVERDWIASLSALYGKSFLNEHHRCDFIGSYTFAGIVADYKKKCHDERMKPVWEQRRKDGELMRIKRNEHRVIHKGKVVNLSQHAKSLGISRQRLDQRIKQCRSLGVSVLQALETPAGEPMPCTKERMGMGRPRKSIQAAVA